MDIHYIHNGSEKVLSVPVTQNAAHEEELMKSDFVRLSFDDAEGIELPLDAYIVPFTDMVRYSLLEPYKPEQRNEEQWHYEPLFQHPKMYLGKVPFVFKTKDSDNNDTTQLEWDYTGYVGTLLERFCEQINAALKLSAAESFTYAIVGKIDDIVSTTFSSMDILSGLSNIAGKLSCEYHLDWELKILYFGHITLNRVGVNKPTLEVGVNVGSPSVRNSKDGFWNAFEPQGSTRNISRKAVTGENVQSTIRLSLRNYLVSGIEKYPDGIIYTDGKGNVITKAQFEQSGVSLHLKSLIFDEVYPKLDLYVYDVRSRERYLLDDDKKKVIDHYENGVPVYKRYSVWYMRLAYPTYNQLGEVTAWTDYTIDPTTQIIDGKSLYGAFQPNTKANAESSPLAGRGSGDDGGYGFALNYHTDNETIPADVDAGDSGVQIKAGDYEIVFQQDGDLIMPTTAAGGIIPKGKSTPSLLGNIVNLYNIVMDSSFTQSAQNELENVAKKEIANYAKDNNSYSVKSYPDAFEGKDENLQDKNPHLFIGQSVTYKNGDYTLETRVMKLVTNLDYDFVQEITVGNEVIKGTTTTLKEQVQSILSGNAGVGGGGVDENLVRRIIKAFGDTRYLSKINDDTAQGLITLIKGLQVGNQFVSGLLGEGGVFRKEADGKTYLEADKLYIRMKAYFDTIEIRDFKHSAGNRVASPAGAKCVRVAWFNSSNEELEQVQENLSSVAYFRCYFRADDGEDIVRNNFVVGDQVYCHITTVNGADDNPSTKGLNQKHYWRLCIGKNTDNNLTEDGEGWVDLSNRSTESIGGKNYTGYQTNSDVPEPQDSMVQLGNVNDTTRQGAIIEFVTGANAPSYQIYQGINSFSLTGRNMITLGYNSATGKAELNVYGDAFIGDPNRTTFIEYVQDDGTEAHAPKLKIKAEVEFTNSKQDLDNFVQSHQRNYDDTEVRGLIDGLQDQIDGQVESWFYNYAPVHVDEHGAPDSRVPLNIAPYSDWTTEADKIAHLGDTFTDNSTGYCWRFSRNEDTNAFEWVVIEDSAIISALQKAAKAQETADNKRRVFLVQPTPPYDAGDIWVNATYPANYTGATDEANHNYNNDILKCVTAKASGSSFSIDDWTLSSKYTDDTKFNGYISALLNNTGLSGDAAAAAAQRAVLSALGVGTVVSGGLLLTSLIGMRQYNGSGDKSDVANYTTWAGISGQYDANVRGGGIAAWYGGGMVDHEVNTTATDFAKSLFRFDGSGYLASGNISWNENGAITIKNITTLSDSNNKNLLNELATFNSAFTFGTSGQGSTTALYITPQVPFKELYIGTSNADKQEVATKNWANGQFVTKTWFDNLFRLYNGSTKINVNDTIPSSNDLNIEAMFGFWTKKYISALGQGDDGTTSYTTLAQLNDVTLSNPTANQILVYDGTHWRNQNQQSVYELPVATTTTLGGIKVGTTLAISSGVLNLPTTGVTAGTYRSVGVDAYGRVTGGTNPTTLSGYGITDAKIANGVITLGANTITPLTSHQTLYTLSVYGGTTKVLDFKPNANASLYIKTGGDISLTNDTTNKYITLSYSHPTNGANTTIAAANGKVLSAITVNNLGHVTSVSSKTLAAADIPDLGGTYLKLSGGTMSNTNLVTNLNADLLDGVHASTFMRKYTAANEVDANTLVDAGSYRLNALGSNFPVTNPNYGQLLVVRGSSDTIAQMYFTYDATRMYVRTGNAVDNANGSWKDWKTVAFTDSNISGNAGSATKLQTARTINGTSFDGSANITTANWGTARNISIADSDSTNTGSAVSVNGSAAVTLKLPSTIKATLSGNASTATTLATARTLWGQSFNGSANVSGDMSSVGSITFTALTGTNARNILYQPMADNDFFRLRVGATATNGGWAEIATADDGNEPIYVRQYTGVFSNVARTLTLLDGSGNTSVPNTLSVGGALNVTGATTLTGLLTANGGIAVPSSKTLKIGDAYLSYDSTNNAIRVSKNADGTGAANFYAIGGVSALGQSTDGSAGSGDVTWALLANNSDTRQIALSHLVGTDGTGGVLATLTNYTTSGKNYKVQQDANHHLYVNVPWENTTYSAGTGISFSGTTINNSGVRATTINGNYLRVNTNGTNADLTIPYATNADFSDKTHKLSSLAGITYGVNYLQYKDYHSDEASNTANAFSNPTADWYHHIIMNHGNSAGYYVDLTICFHSDSMYYRRIVGGSTNAWVRVIDSSNIGSQSVNYATSAGKATNDSDGNAINTTYLKKSGGTMTGIEIISATSAINFPNRTTSGTRASYYTSGNYIHGGEDHADQDGANVQVGTWYGFGIYPTISGQTRTQGKNSFWHNARTGNTYTWGEFYSYDGSTNRKVLHEGNSSVSKSGETLTVKINGTSQSLTNTWRGITDDYNPSTGNSTISLSQVGALNMYNKLTKTKGRWNWSGSGQNAYCLIATINTNSSYINFPITFEINGRGLSMTRITVWYKNQLDVDPDIDRFTTDQATSFYLYKVSANTWNLYGNSSDGIWGTLNLYSVRSERENLVTIKMESVASLPTGYIQPSYTGNVSYATSAGNSATATKLQTSRTLWGQSFDGSANVSGDMSSVGTITFSPLGGANARNILYQPMADNDYFRLRVGATATNGGWVEIATADDGNEPIYVRQYTGVFSNVARTLTLLDGSGNTSVPNTLSVGGALNVTGATTLTGLLTANGGIAIASSKTLKIGDAYLSYDSTNNAIRVSKNADGTGAANFYAIGGVSALGQSTDGSAGTGDVTWALLASNSDTRQIALSHLTTSLGTLTSYTTSGKNYAVQKDSSNHLFVNVPWDNTNTTYSAGAGLSLSGTTFNIKGLSSGAWFNGTAYVGGDGVMEVGRYIDFHPTSASTLDYSARIDCGTSTTVRTFMLPDSGGTILTSGNSSVSKSGETLTVKINGTTQSLTNTNTTYSAGSGLSLSGTTFSIASNVLIQGSVIDTHHEGNDTVTLDGTNELYAFYDRGGTCDAYEVEQSATLTNQTLTRTSTSVGALSANVFNGLVGYNQSSVYQGDKFAVYDLALPANYPYGAAFFWSFGNGGWTPAKMRILIGKYNASGFTYISKYSSDACPAYGKVGIGNSATGFDRLRIVVSKYLRLACFGITFYASTGLRTTYMNRCLDDAVYRNISPAKDNTWVLGTSSLRWKEVRAVNLYGSLTGNASSATKLQTSRTIWGQSFDGSGDITGKLSIGTTTTSHATKLEVRTANTTADTVEWGMAIKNPYNDANNYKLGAGFRIALGAETETTKFGGIAYIGTATYFNSGKLAFYASGAERAYLTSDNLYIGGNAVCHAGNSSVSKSGETLTVKINGTSQSLTNTNTTYSAGKGLRLSGTQFISDAPRVAKDSKVFGGANTWIMEEYTHGTAYNLPSDAWYHIMSTQGADTNYGTQLALGMTTAAAYYRVYNGGTWGNWQSIINTWRGIQNNLTSDSTTDSLSAAQGKALANGSARDNTKLPLSGGTMTGNLKIATGLGISDASDNGMLVYHPTDWSGVSSSQWGVGAAVCEGVIRSSASALKHYRYNDGTYEIIDSKGGQTINSSLQIGSSNGAYLQIGAIRLVYDSSNNAVKVIKSDGGNANFYATGGVSALGAGTESGGGGNYLPLSGGTLSGTLRVATGYGISDASDNGLLVYHPVDWTGVTSSQWGVGAANSEGVIRSSNTSLKHYRYGVGLCDIIDSMGGTINGQLSVSYNNYPNINLSCPSEGEVSIYYKNSSNYGWAAGQRTWSDTVGNGFGIGEYNYGLRVCFYINTNGTCVATHGFTNQSDARFKTILKDVDLSVEQIAKMPTVLYRWNDRKDAKIYAGSVAQNWESVLPQVVDIGTDERHFRSLDYGVAALISTITVARKVMTHEEKIALLETRVSALEKENGEQEQLINSLQEELAKFKSE